MTTLLEIQGLASDSTAQILTETNNRVFSINILDLILKGGWMMLPIFILLLLSIYVLVERILIVKKYSKEDSSFMSRIKDYILADKISSAIRLCKETNTISSRIIEKGISRLGQPNNEVITTIENAGNIETAKLERRLAILSTTSAGAPMLGFLGTVIGMVKAFMSMAASGTSIDISVLSTGIYEALLTTVAGLVVGIIALFSYNYLVAEIKGVIDSTESKIMDFMDILNEPLS